MRKAITTGLTLLSLLSPVREINAVPTKPQSDPQLNLKRKIKQPSLKEAMQVLGIKKKNKVKMIQRNGEIYYTTKTAYERLTAVASLYAKKAHIDLIDNKSYRISGKLPNMQEILYAIKK